MPFPDSPRVIYEKNPLIEVICALSFPAILRIDSEVPAKYQERLKNIYPIFSESQASDIKLNVAPEIAQIIGSNQSLSFRGRAVYSFVSADKQWKVSLSRESLSLSTRKYERWEDFKEHLREPLSALIKEYNPAFFSRIGLRYQDVIQKSKLDLTDCSWGQLLEPHLAGELSSPDIAQDILSCVNQLILALDEESRVLLNHGFASNQNNETCYLIDSDFFTEERTETNNVIQKLDYFNRQSGRLFRWCISEKLHGALNPKPL